MVSRITGGHTGLGNTGRRRCSPAASSGCGSVEDMLIRTIAPVGGTRVCLRDSYELSGRMLLGTGGCSRSSPAPERGAPVEAGAEAGGQEQVAALDAPSRYELIEGDRDRAGRGIAVALEVFEDGIPVESEHVAGGVDDPHVGLVRDEPADARHLASGVLEHDLDESARMRTAHLKTALSVHGQVMKAFFEHGRRGRNPAAAGRPAERSPPEPSEPS